MDYIIVYNYIYIIRSAIYVFSVKKGGGAENLVFGSLFSLIMAFFVFSVMSEFSLDDPGLRPRFLLCLHRRPILRLKLPLMVDESVPPVPGG